MCVHVSAAAGGEGSRCEWALHHGELARHPLQAFGDTVPHPPALGL